MTPITALGSRYGIQGALGRSVKRAAATSWWLAGGISASDCIAAYQPKGAASYAASLININNPGTRNLTNTGIDPSWDATNGWTVVKGAGLTMGNWAFDLGHDYSFICNLTVSLTGESGYPIYTAYNYAIVVQSRLNNFQTIYRDTQRINTIYGTQSGVFAITRYGAYKDAVALSTYSASQINSTKEVQIIWDGSTGIQLDIKAWALYQIDITSTYLSALTTAMNAL
jgi:hypothetical protein